ncbi:MAG: D-glycerate 2-kinase [Dehalococcoidia bacterium]|nr:D-glycerate 2-kinase [Chloroflexota bacterium]MBT9163532.1 D-glycerate 2-kinase [Chloroflexota bacterium]
MKGRADFNRAELLRDERMQRERADVLEILAAALEAVDPAKLIKCHVRLERDQLIIGQRTYDLKRHQKIFVIGGGKASGALVPAIEEILGKNITAGMVNTKYGYTAETEIIKINEAGHPIPDRNGVRGMEEIQRLLSIAAEGDLVICLLSGGGSALLPLPAPGIGLEEMGRVTDLLLKAGATIDELNTVRKHICSVKGGQLVRMVYPAELVSIILSDVVGDSLSTIASGPTVPDPTTFADAQRVLQRYDLWDEVPKLKERITRGIAGDISETPKEGDPIFSRVHNFVIGNNRLAVEAAIERARERGFNPMLLSTFLEGEAREVGKLFAAIAREILESGHPVCRKALVVGGGETTVTVRGGGKGGRNQELALSAAIAIGGLENIVIASLATDGTDGPTDGAGGLVDGYTVDRARERGLDPIKHLDNNDSYNLLRRTGDLIVTGPTNTNVNDLVIAAIF